MTFGDLASWCVLLKLYSTLYTKFQIGPSAAVPHVYHLVRWPKEGWILHLSLTSELPPFPILCQRPRHSLRHCPWTRECSPGLEANSLCPPQEAVCCGLQQPFLIWLALGWHIPEPKCTHKLLSLVAELFTPEWLLSGAVEHSQLDYPDKEKGLQYIISTPFGSRNACLDSFAWESTSPFLLSRGHWPTLILALYLTNTRPSS